MENGDAGEFGARALQPDGFVHLSFVGQIEGTLQRHYAGFAELVLFEIDRERVRPALRIEPSRGGVDFPHLYRALEPADLCRRWSLKKNGDRFDMPELASDSELDRPAGQPVVHS